MELFNPTDQLVYIVHKGVRYEAPANGVAKDLPEEVATHWRSVHQFLTLPESYVVESVPTTFEVEETVHEEPVVDELKEEKPKKKEAKK